MFEFESVKKEAWQAGLKFETDRILNIREYPMFFDTGYWQSKLGTSKYQIRPVRFNYRINVSSTSDDRHRAGDCSTFRATPMELIPNYYPQYTPKPPCVFVVQRNERGGKAARRSRVEPERTRRKAVSRYSLNDRLDEAGLPSADHVIIGLGLLIPHTRPNCRAYLETRHANYH